MKTWVLLKWMVKMKLGLSPYKSNTFSTSAKTTAIRNVNDDVRLQALIDGKKVIINKASIRHDLKLNDAEGTSCLSNAIIFEELARMSAKTTSWNEFSSTMASSIICLANNKKFKISKYILTSFVKNLVGGVPFYMFPRFIQVFVNHQPGDMSHHKVTPLFGTMMVQALKEVGDLPTDVQDTPILDEPSSSQPQRNHKLRRKQRMETKVSPTETNTKEHVPTPSNDPLPSGKDRMQLKELIDLCTNLSNKVLDLENEELKSFNTRVESPTIKETIMDKEESSKQGRKTANIDADVEVNLENVYNLDMAHKETVLSMQDVDVQSEMINVVKEAAEVKEVVEVKEVAEEMMYLAFATMLKNFDREDLEVLWKIIKDRFKKTQPKEVLDVFLWNTLKVMFEHTVEDNVWKHQKGP
nr:hypothetical protein [Tanacetum cinerariifolium]